MLDIQQELEKYAILDSDGMPVYDFYQMCQIRKGLEAGVDVSQYATLYPSGRPVYSGREMQEIRECLEAEMEASKSTTLDSKEESISDYNQIHTRDLKLEPVSLEEAEKIKNMLGDQKDKYKNAWKIMPETTSEALTEENGEISHPSHGLRSENYWSTITNGLATLNSEAFDKYCETENLTEESHDIPVPEDDEEMSL